MQKLPLVPSVSKLQNLNWNNFTVQPYTGCSNSRTHPLHAFHQFPHMCRHIIDIVTCRPLLWLAWWGILPFHLHLLLCLHGIRKCLCHALGFKANLIDIVIAKAAPALPALRKTVVGLSHGKDAEGSSWLKVSMLISSFLRNQVKLPSATLQGSF